MHVEMREDSKIEPYPHFSRPPHGQEDEPRPEIHCFPSQRLLAHGQLQGRVALATTASLQVKNLQLTSLMLL
jgi:hypothetical protein